MNETVSTLTVFFEDPFWVGLYERQSGTRYEVCKITFGPEPSDGEVYALIRDHWDEMRFSPSIAVAALRSVHVSPKRRQRQAARAVSGSFVGTRSQQALHLQREEGKLARRVFTSAQREAHKAACFARRQEKRREKRKGH